MSKYNEWVSALGRARERVLAEKARIEKVHAMILKAIAAELGSNAKVVTTTQLVESSHFLHLPAENTVYKNELSIVLRDEDPEPEHLGVTFRFPMSYGIMTAVGDVDPHASVTVSINGRHNVTVNDDQTAREVAREIVASIDDVLRLGGNARVGRPTIDG